MKIRNSKDFLMHFGLTTSKYVAGGVFTIHPSRDIWNVDVLLLLEYCNKLELFDELVQDFKTLRDVYDFIEENGESDELFEFIQDGYPTVMTAKGFESVFVDLKPLAEEYNGHQIFIPQDFWRGEWYYN